MRVQANEVTPLLDHYMEQYTAFASQVNGVSAEEALSNPTYYDQIASLSHESARALCDLAGNGDREAVIKLLHRHPLHQHILLQSAFIKHAFTKPHGYAGDKDLMLMICGKEDRGDSNFAILKNRVYLDLPAAEAVRQRVHSMYRVFQQLPDGSKALNLACGPALEVQRFVQDFPERGIQFDLIDHDVTTVKYAQEHLADDRITVALGNAFRIIKGSYRMATLPKQVAYAQEVGTNSAGGVATLSAAKYKPYDLKRGAYDLVYSAGLFDYIQTFDDEPDKGAPALTRRLFDLVKPGGKLIIGNYLSPSDNNPHQNHHRAMMEMYSHWNLIYRTPTEIQSFMDGVARDRFTMHITNEYFDAEKQAQGVIGVLVATKIG